MVHWGLVRTWRFGLSMRLDRCCLQTGPGFLCSADVDRVSLLEALSNRAVRTNYGPTVSGIHQPLPLGELMDGVSFRDARCGWRMEAGLMEVEWEYDARCAVGAIDFAVAPFKDAACIATSRESAYVASLRWRLLSKIESIAVTARELIWLSSRQSIVSIRLPRPGETGEVKCMFHDLLIDERPKQGRQGREGTQVTALRQRCY